MGASRAITGRQYPASPYGSEKTISFTNLRIFLFYVRCRTLKNVSLNKIITNNHKTDYKCSILPII